jgi:hypothetical protein
MLFHRSFGKIGMLKVASTHSMMSSQRKWDQNVMHSLQEARSLPVTLTGMIFTESTGQALSLKISHVGEQPSLMVRKELTNVDTQCKSTPHGCHIFSTLMVLSLEISYLTT